MLLRKSKEVSITQTKENMNKRVVIGVKQGAPNFTMRIIEIPPGVSTYHSHDWEHEVFVLSGKAIWVNKDGETPMEPEDVIYVPPLEEHGITNRNKEPFRFICVVPNKGEDTP